MKASARDLAVARAVRDACTHAGNDKWMRYVRGLDLEAIIAALPEPAQDADAQAWMNAPMGKPAQEEPTPQPDPDEVRRLIARYRLAGSYLAPVFDAAAAWLRDREQQQDYSKPPAGYEDRCDAVEDGHRCLMELGHDVHHGEGVSWHVERKRLVPPDPLPAPTGPGWPDWLSPEYRALVEMVKAAMDRAEEDICNSEDASGLPRTHEGERNLYAGAILHAFKMAGWVPPGGGE